MSLHQIGQALPLGEDGQPPCGYVLGVLAEQAKTVAARIRELELLQARLTALIAAASRGYPGSHAPFSVIGPHLRQIQLPIQERPPCNRTS